MDYQRVDLMAVQMVDESVEMMDAIQVEMMVVMMDDEWADQ